MGQHQMFELTLKPTHGKLRTQLYNLNVIRSEAFDDEGHLHLQVMIAPQKLEQLIRQAHISLDDVLGEQATRFKRPLEEFEIKR